MYAFIPRFLAEPLPMFCGTLTDVLRNPGWETVVYNITDIPF